MKKKIIVLFAILALCLTISFPAYAESTSESQAYDYNAVYPRLVDNADLISDSDESSLLAKLDEISERQGVDVVVVTVYSLDGKSSRDYADDFFDYNGYGQSNNRDGLLLLHSPEERDWWISTSGSCIRYFTDAGIEYIGDKIKPYLADEEYADAYNEFADLSDKFITKAKNGDPYDVDNLPFEGLSLMWIPISIVIGLIIAGIGVLIMKGKLKSVRYEPAANNYMINGSLNITERYDLFLYRNVVRKRKPQQSSSSGGSSVHTSASGSSHGGGGGKY